MTTVVVRTFCVESEEERRSWVQAIESVKKKLDEESMETEQTEEPDRIYVDMFGRRGTSRGKVVSSLSCSGNYIRHLTFRDI